MMQHPDRKGIIEYSRERQVIDVCLYDVRVRQFTRRRKGSFHRIAQIDADYVSRAKLCGQLCMSALSTTGRTIWRARRNRRRSERCGGNRSEEHTSELQSQSKLVCRL